MCDDAEGQHCAHNVVVVGGDGTGLVDWRGEQSEAGDELMIADTVEYTI
jgi:hypothetical protein